MSGKKKAPSINIPEFNKPTPASFDLLGLKSEYANGGYQLVEDSQNKADRLSAEQIRRDLIQSLGLGSGTLSDPYAQMFADESLRVSQPRLENALIGRGLGGSTIYKEALTDLINRASIDAALNTNNLKLNNLGAISSNYLEPYYQRGQQLLGLTAQTGLQEQQLAQQRYLAMLPYTATVTTPGNNGLMGALAGAGTGAIIGGIPGAIAGGASGYFSSQQSPQTQSLLSYQLALESEAKKNQGNQLLQLLQSGGGGGSFTNAFAS